METLSDITYTPTESIVRSDVEGLNGTQRSICLGQAHRRLIHEVLQVVGQAAEDLDMPPELRYSVYDTAHEVVGCLLDAQSIRELAYEYLEVDIEDFKAKYM